MRHLDPADQTAARIVLTSRAQVIGKDRRPQWSPATLEAVSAADVAAYFTHLGPRELRLATAASGATA